MGFLCLVVFNRTYTELSYCKLLLQRKTRCVDLIYEKLYLKFAIRDGVFLKPLVQIKTKLKFHSSFKPFHTNSLGLIQCKPIETIITVLWCRGREHVFSETCQNKTSYYDSRRNAKKIIFSISRFCVRNTKYTLCGKIDFLTLSCCTYISIFMYAKIFKWNLFIEECLRHYIYLRQYVNINIEV